MADGIEILGADVSRRSLLRAVALGVRKPDPAAFQIVKAFVALKTGVVATDLLRRELKGFARTRLGAAVAPKQFP